MRSFFRTQVYPLRRKLLTIFAAVTLLGLFIQARNTDAYFEISKNLEIFTGLFKELNAYYVDPIQPGKLVKSGIDAMLDDLDPYTNYITEEDIEDYRFMTTGKYGGIGSGIVKKGDDIVISEPYENSPVLQAGLKAGDIILAIDGKSTQGKSVEDLSKLLKGSPGTTLQLSVKDGVSGVVADKTITRREIQISSVPYAGLVGANKEYAYVRLSQFTERCGSQVRAAFDSLKRVNPNIKGAILDLRGNPGGLLDEAVNLCNIFLNGNQLVVSTKGKNKEWDKDYRTMGTPWDDKIPVSVLINRGSASASEIVAGTLQDVDRGVVIGQRSFGKGLVQTTRPLPFNAKLKVTTAKYYTPSGRCIQALDYSHRNEDGSVGEVADSLKSTFKTKAGRIVKDGGGIAPDIKLTERTLLPIEQSLLNKFYIFDYATQYVSKNPKPAKADAVQLSEADFNAFVQWLDGKDYSYKTKTEELLTQLKETAKTENYYEGIRNDLGSLEKSVTHDKKLDLLKHKKEITRLLQAEIASRYFYQRGRIENLLLGDEELESACKVLGNPTQYAQLLKPSN